MQGFTAARRFRRGDPGAEVAHRKLRAFFRVPQLDPAVLADRCADVGHRGVPRHVVQRGSAPGDEDANARRGNFPKVALVGAHVKFHGSGSRLLPVALLRRANLSGDVRPVLGSCAHLTRGFLDVGFGLNGDGEGSNHRRRRTRSHRRLEHDFINLTDDIIAVISQRPRDDAPVNPPGDQHVGFLEQQ